MFDSIRETCYVYIWYYVIPLLEQYSVYYVQYIFMNFDILLLTFWHYCKICRFPTLTVRKGILLIHYINRPFISRFWWCFEFYLNGKCRLGTFQVVVFVNCQYIYHHIKTLWSLIKSRPFYSAFSFWDNKIVNL